jgi:hypothetical protein
MGRTPYAETEALLAVMEGNNADAYRILRGMYPYELRAFRDQLEHVVDLTLEAETTGLVDGPVDDPVTTS